MAASSPAPTAARCWPGFCSPNSTLARTVSLCIMLAAALQALMTARSSPGSFRFVCAQKKACAGHTTQGRACLDASDSGGHHDFAVQQACKILSAFRLTRVSAG